MAAADPQSSTRPQPICAAVVLAGGQGSRVGAAVNKAFLPLAGAHVVSWSFRWARQVREINTFVLVTRAQDVEVATRVLATDLPGLGVEIVVGGTTRQGSEHAALDHLAARIQAGTIDVVALHDGARPLAGPALWRRAISAAAEFGGAVPVLATEPLARVQEGVLDAGLGRPDRPGHRLVRVQTPQVFRARLLLEAYERAREQGVDATDTAGTVQACSSMAIHVVDGSPLNLKVTYPHDLAVAEQLLARHASDLA